MTNAELKKMERCDVAYLYLLCNLQLYKQKLEKITLYRKRGDKGRYVASVTCYLADYNNNLHTLYFRLYDEQYLWFLCAVQADFPEVEFEDLTPEEFKVVKTDGGEQNDIQTSEETRL